MQDSEKAAKIAALNDGYRKRGHFMLTDGIKARDDVEAIIEAVRSFNDFGRKNDPYGEHDMGKIEWPSTRTVHGAVIFWKIDYYDLNLQYYCDPLSAYCNRVLTVMLASEY